MLCSKVRIITMSTIREMTSATSSIGSPRPSCVSRLLRNRACPPNWAMPASKDTRVRVEFFAKIMARVRPLSGWYSVPACWRCFRILARPSR